MASKMSEKFRLDRKIGFHNMYYTKCINDIIKSIGPSIILRSTDSSSKDLAKIYVILYKYLKCLSSKHIFTINR